MHNDGSVHLVPWGHRPRAISLAWGLSTWTLLTLELSGFLAVETALLTPRMSGTIPDLYPVDATSPSPKSWQWKSVSRCCWHPLMDKTAPWGNSLKILPVQDEAQWGLRDWVAVQEAKTSGGKDFASRAPEQYKNGEVRSREPKGWMERGRRRIQISPALLTYLCWFFVYLCFSLGQADSFILIYFIYFYFTYA